MRDSTLVLPAITQSGQSSWPGKFPLKFLQKKRNDMGVFIFNAQYQCDCEAMKGEIFRYDDLKTHPDSEFPKLSGLAIYQGVDLAISTKEQNDCFAQVVVGVNKDSEGQDHIWVLDFEEAQLRFNQQTSHILKLYKDFRVIQCGVESNAYQRSQLHNLKNEDPNFRGIPVYTTKDKVTRAWKLAALCEAGQIHFRKRHHKLLEHLLRFPSHRRKDLFDALDIAVSIATRRKKKRRKKLGLI
jgi:phage terminase large subunit-like protein